MLTAATSNLRVTLPERVRIVDALRGIASLAVCLFHLTNGKADFLPSGLLKSAGSYGWLGVEVFFVISGFILPYALWRAGYQIRHFGTFLLKRVTRLDPPYIATIGLIIVLNYLAAMIPGFKGEPFEVSALQVVLHAAYLNAFFGYEWLSPIFWTLAIEFQFYWLIGLLFPLVVHSRLWIRGGLFGVLVAMAVLIPAGGFVFHWLPLFLMGMLAFQNRVAFIGKRDFFVGLGCLIALAVYTHGMLIASVGAVTATAVVSANFNSDVLSFPGKISYSLYLIHVIVGMKMVNLGSRYVSGMPGKLLVLTLALAASIAAAYVLYRLIEDPAQRWASAIRFRSSKLKALIPVTQEV